MSDESIELEVTYAIPVQRLPDILTVAFEGGINYWARIEDYRREYDYIARLATIIDREDAYVRYALHHYGLTQGLRICATKYPKHFSDFLTGHDDANTADAIIQCAAFGEIRYG